MSKHGKKHVCWSCTTKFYDFNKPDPRCPKCSADPAAAPEVEPPKPDDFDDDDDEAAVVVQAAADEEE